MDRLTKVKFWRGASPKYTATERDIKALETELVLLGGVNET